MPSHSATQFSDSVCLVQLTDSHIFAGSSQRLLGVDTQASLNAVIDLVLEECQQIDLVLATGDITQDASVQGYRDFMAAFARLRKPWCWLPGNHDDAAVMSTLAREQGLEPDWVDLAGWRIVLLDSSVPGQVHGHLGREQLARLDRALETAGQRYVLVCLHHHPVTIGSDWMDTIGLHNADELWSRLDPHPQVRGVLWGHIHQQLEQQRGHIRLMASPSTCVQFAVGSSGFATDDQPPGYRWLRLYGDGRIESAVSRLPTGHFIAQAGAAGY